MTFTTSLRWKWAWAKDAWGCFTWRWIIVFGRDRWCWRSWRWVERNRWKNIITVFSVHGKWRWRWNRDSGWNGSWWSCGNINTGNIISFGTGNSCSPSRPASSRSRTGSFHTKTNHWTDDSQSTGKSLHIPPKWHRHSDHNQTGKTQSESQRY